jgi:flap endonuclease-1
MGVNISELIEPRETNFEALAGKVVAIDAYNTLYQFLSIIRQPDGTPLHDAAGRVTSHLSGLIYRTTHLLEQQIRPIFVFDGKPSELKAGVIKERSERRTEARRRWEEAKIIAPEEALKYAKASARIDETIVEDARTLLTYLGIPSVQAKAEGEAQAAYMVQQGDADLVSSQDYDALLFGAPVVVRNLTSPRRKVQLELVTLRELEAKHGITREELIDLAILIGTDFNPGIRGIGAKRALKLIQKHHRIERLQAEAEIEQIENYELVRAIFLHPAVNDSYELTWGTPDVEKVKAFLCDEHNFSEDRVSKVLEKLEAKPKKAAAAQRQIGQWL